MADYATLVYEVDSNQVRGAAKVLGDLNSATIKASNGFAKFEKTMRGADGRFRSTSKYISEHRGEIEGLAMAYNPAMAAQIRYRDEAVRTATAVKAGVITEQQRVDILQRTRAALDAAAAAATKFGATNQVASHHAANLSFQLNDIGMMMASGQNPFMLMIQQGPQVAQIFSQMNAEGRKIGPTIAGAFKMFLNPTTAVTLALIGGSAALFQWGKSAISAGRDAEKFSDSISGLEESLSGLGQFSKFDFATRRMNTSLGDIVTKYGDINKGVERHIQLLNDAAIASANLSQMNYMSLFTETFDTGWLTTRVDEVRIAFDATNDSARRLIMLMDEAGKAKGLTAQREAAEAVRDYVLDISGGYQNMTSEQLKFAMELNRIVDSLRQMEVSVDRTTGNVVESARQTAIWERNMAAVKAQIDAISRSLNAIAGFQIATVSAQLEERLLATGVAAGDAARQVQKFETAASFMDRRKALMAQYSGNYNDPGYKTQIRLLAEEEAAANRAADAQYSLGQTRERLAEEERARRKAESGGKGAAGRASADVRAAEKGFQSLRELMENDTLFQYAEYEKRQAQLDTALSKRLISEQNYQILRDQLQTLYFGTEYEKEGMQFLLRQQQLDEALAQQKISHERYNEEIAAINAERQGAMLSGWSGVFGNMASIISSGGNKATAAYKAFAIAQGMLDSYLAYTKVLADPSLIGRPYLRTALAASTLAAGLAQVANMRKVGGGGGGGGGASAATAAAKVEPERQVLVRLEGDEWLVNMADSIMSEIYKQTKDGRVVIARQY